MTVGALARGLPISDGQCTGGPFGGFSPLACLCGIGLCLGYALLGAGWQVAKAADRLRDRAYAVLPRLTAGAFVFLTVAFVYALAMNIPIMHRWLERPYLAAFPAIGLWAAVKLVRGAQAQHDLVPFGMMSRIFITAFGIIPALDVDLDQCISGAHAGYGTCCSVRASRMNGRGAGAAAGIRDRACHQRSIRKLEK